MFPINKLVKFLPALILFFIPKMVFAVTYYCEATKKYDSENIYSKQHIAKGKFAVQLEDMGEEAFISRCSFSSTANAVTCDRYEVDHINRSAVANLETFKYDKFIKKYYYFQGQLDFQLYPDLSFVENNGRGGIQYGKCEVTSP